MPAAGTTGELYAEADNPSSTLGAPPAPPADVPPPTKEPHQPVQVRNHRMADEKPDGSIRDTSTEALRPGNDLGFRNLDDEPVKKGDAPVPVEAEKPAVEVAPVKEAAPVPEKLYAGKFKSTEELEKGYEEAQKLITRQGQEKAERERQALAIPPIAPVKTAEQVAAETAEANQLVTDFVSDPKKFIQEKIVNQTMTALAVQEITNNWRKENRDIAEHEIRVAFEASLLAQSDPEIARNPAALLSKATDNFRQFTGKIRTEGAKEALTQETRTIPLLQPSSTTTATEQPAKAPLTADAAYEQHLQMLKSQEQRSHRGLRR